jgi:hypothetical protein
MLFRVPQDGVNEAVADVQHLLRRSRGQTEPKELAAEAFHLNEKFRPAIPSGKKGWGVKGKLNLALTEKLAKRDG